MPIAISRAARDQITLDKITDNRGLTVSFINEIINARSLIDSVSIKALLTGQHYSVPQRFARAVMRYLRVIFHSDIFLFVSTTGSRVVERGFGEKAI